MKIQDNFAGFSEDNQKVELKTLQREEGYRGVLDIDQYASSLMEQLSINDSTLDELGATLAMATTRKKRPGHVGAEQLAKNWRIGLEAAKRTLEATTQLAVRDFSTITGTRRLKWNHWLLHRKRIDCPVYTDVVYGRCKSLRGNEYASVYATAFHFIKVVALKEKSDAHFTLDEFFEEVGIPSVMISDNAKELTLGEFKQKLKRAQCKMHPIEAYTPNANLVEGVIRELKRHYRRVMEETGAPEVLWDYCLEWCAMIRSHTALNLRQLDGKVPATLISGDTKDISHLAEFGFYDWVWYIEHPTSTSNIGQEVTQEPSMQKKRLGRYLGPSNNVGGAMSSVVLTEKAQVKDKTSVFPLSIADINTESMKEKKKVYQAYLAKFLKHRIQGIKPKTRQTSQKKLEEELEAELKGWAAADTP